MDIRTPAKQVVRARHERDRTAVERLHRLEEETHRLEAAEKAAREAEALATQESAIGLQELKERRKQRQSGGGVRGDAG